MLPLRKVIPMRFLLHSDSPLLLARDESLSSLTTRLCGRQLALEIHEDGMSDKKYFVTVLGRHILVVPFHWAPSSAPSFFHFKEPVPGISQA